MKSKNPSKHRVPRGAAASGGRSGTGGRAITLDFVQYRIEAFNREQGGGVLVRKDRNGYTLVREESGMPIARLRPKDDKGQYEVLYWSPDTDRWRAVGLHGGTILALRRSPRFHRRRSHGLLLDVRGWFDGQARRQSCGAVARTELDGRTEGLQNRRQHPQSRPD